MFEKKEKIKMLKLLILLTLGVIQKTIITRIFARNPVVPVPRAQNPII